MFDNAHCYHESWLATYDRHTCVIVQFINILSPRGAAFPCWMFFCWFNLEPAITKLGIAFDILPMAVMLAWVIGGSSKCNAWVWWKDGISYSRGNEMSGFSATGWARCTKCLVEFWIRLNVGLMRVSWWLKDGYNKEKPCTNNLVLFYFNSFDKV
jgi:hypothetical protein